MPINDLAKQGGLQSFMPYRLLPDGKLQDLNEKNYLQEMISINVLLFYTLPTHQLYVWVGKNVNAVLRKRAEIVEKTFHKEHPNSEISGTMQIDQGNETKQFFKALKLDRVKYDNRQKQWNEYQLKQYELINNYQVVKANYAIVCNYDEALEIIKLIIREAEKIGDTRLISELEADQEELLTKKREAEEKKECEDPEEMLINQINKLKNEIQQKMIEEDWDSVDTQLKELQDIALRSSFDWVQKDIAEFSAHIQERKQFN